MPWLRPAAPPNDACQYARDRRRSIPRSTMSDFEEAIERAAIAFLWALTPSADEKASSEASRAMIAAVGIRARRTGGVFTADNVDATAAAIAALAREKFRSWIMRPGGPLPESRTLRPCPGSTACSTRPSKRGSWRLLRAVVKSCDPARASCCVRACGFCRIILRASPSRLRRRSEGRRRPAELARVSGAGVGR